ncbi:MAG: hypothetical protein GWN62_10550, partial [Aliifodinibius sp.]|nr:hypothetical protein [Fodinibius sp.]
MIAIGRLSFLTVLSITFGFLINCVEEKVGPPEDVIKEAKVKTESIIDKVKLTDETITGEPELIEEYWDKENKRYVLKYYVDTVHG